MISSRLPANVRKIVLAFSVLPIVYFFLLLGFALLFRNVIIPRMFVLPVWPVAEAVAVIEEDWNALTGAQILWKMGSAVAFVCGLYGIAGLAIAIMWNAIRRRTA